jgi:hypothetical protein
LEAIKCKKCVIAYGSLYSVYLYGILGSGFRITDFGFRVYYQVCGEGENTDDILPHNKRIELPQRLKSRVQGVIDTVARFSVTEQIARV